MRRSRIRFTRKRGFRHGPSKYRVFGFRKRSWAR